MFLNMMTQFKRGGGGEYITVRTQSLSANNGSRITCLCRRRSEEPLSWVCLQRSHHPTPWVKRNSALVGLPLTGDLKRLTSESPFGGPGFSAS